MSGAESTGGHEGDMPVIEVPQGYYAFATAGELISREVESCMVAAVRDPDTGLTFVGHFRTNEQEQWRKANQMFTEIEAQNIDMGRAQVWLGGATKFQDPGYDSVIRFYNQTIDLERQRWRETFIEHDVPPERIQEEWSGIAEQIALFRINCETGNIVVQTAPLKPPSSFNE